MMSLLAAKVFSFLKDSYHKRIYNVYRKRYTIDKSFLFNGEDILMYGEGDIIINTNSYIGRRSLLYASSGHYIKIGRNCKIGPGLNIWTSSNVVDADFNCPETIQTKHGSVTIGDGVWVGANVFISPGVTIGENSIIGANSVVTKDVSDFSIVGGVPAKLLRHKKLDNK